MMVINNDQNDNTENTENNDNDHDRHHDHHDEYQCIYIRVYNLIFADVHVLTCRHTVSPE